LLEHLPLDCKNIKESLCHITNYIKHKSIDCTKANNILDLNGIGEVTWNFMLAIYKSEWDTLITNKNNKTFRQQIASKFTPKIQETKKPSKDDNLTDKPVSFAKLPLLISVKSPKEVKEISKFFKKSIKPTEKKDSSKLYAQASVPMTSEILKIIEIFSKLQASKINNIHKIINGVGKPKPKVYMTTKRLSRKQVIILMSNKNKIRLIESSSKHIANLNRVLENIKLDIMANFVCMDQAGITIITNKVTTSLDLQTIKRYIKNANQIDSDNVKTS